MSATGLTISTPSRVVAIDGLRAFAVLGVIWAHMWAFGFGAIPLSIGPLNLNKVFSVVGTGVDLFFVISGYCMYIAYLGKPKARSQGMGRFLWRRYLRIAPAYYAAIVFCLFAMGGVDVLSLLAHLLFLQYVVVGVTEIATPFWSVCTEMQFYFILPILVAVGEKRLWPTVVVLACLSLLFSLSIEMASTEVIDYFHKQLPVRLVEFCFGILLAIILQDKAEKTTPFWVVLSLSVFLICAGRVLMSSYFVDNASVYLRILGRSGLTILSSGYAVLVYASVSYDSMLSKILKLGFVQFLGRVSYSMYLLHWFPCLWIARWFCAKFGANNFALTVSFCFTVGLLSVASYVSYQLFESPYFRLAHKK